MSEIGKYPLDDEELEKVSGGATANQVCNCGYCLRINFALPVSCSNCRNYDDGNCDHISELQ